MPCVVWSCIRLKSVGRDFMAEVLSQSQIDALLNAVRSGEKDLNEPAEEQQEKYPIPVDGSPDTAYQLF